MAATTARDQTLINPREPHYLVPRPSEVFRSMGMTQFSDRTVGEDESAAGPVNAAIGRSPSARGIRRRDAAYRK